MMIEYTFVDLFAGAGGFSEGFLLAGTQDLRFRLAAASDIHKNAELTHTGRFRDQLGIKYEFITDDIKSENFVHRLTTSIEKSIGSQQVDVVCGGPPCQGFSVWGKRDESDPRNDLFLHYLTVIESLKPKYFVMENVPGLVRMYSGKIPIRIKKEVERRFGKYYKINGPISVNAVDHGVPQFRERILFIGTRYDCEELFSIPPSITSDRRVSVGEAISDLAFLRPWQVAHEYEEKFPATTSYQTESRNGRLHKKLKVKYKPLKLSNHEAAKHSVPVVARFALIQKGQGFESIPPELWKQLSTKKKWCVKLDDRFPANTMTTLADDFIHYEVARCITVREMARLQSFDDTFSFKGPRTTGGGGAGNKKRTIELPQYTQVGNAVPPLLAKGIASKLLTCLSRLDGSKAILQNETTRLLHRAV